ncbi:hypothetical protein OQA88_2691 [Cercophora sp. LCS_1]
MTFTTEPPRPRIVLLCDGTWCGRETGTRTNIYHLAQLFGVDIDDPNSTAAQCRRPNPLAPPDRQIHVRYRNGVGLGSSFIDYLFNGVTAQDLADEVTSAYRYIVERYTPGHEIWLFGISRGAYTVRCVAGMINNCGIIRRHDLDDGETDLLCREAYRMYRSKDALHAPKSEQMVGFRRRMAWPLVGDEADQEDGEEERLRPPVRFMGLFDTVGGLGVPTFTGGVGLEWPEFHDNEVSSVVQDVCHLLSLHDRFYIFQPCLASRKGGGKEGIDEEWLPGCHYDLARQRFQFWRSGAGWAESLIGWVHTIPLLGWGKVIEPNHVLSDLALWKMLERVAKHDVGHQLLPESVLVSEMVNLAGAMMDPRRKIGSGDVYEHIVQYGPFGSPIGKFVTKVAGGLGAWKLFFDIRERVIPNDRANVYQFGSRDPGISGVQAVGQLACINPERYPSRTAEAWSLRSGRPWP